MSKLEPVDQDAAQAGRELIFGFDPASLTAETLLGTMWEAYASKQCGWQDAMSYHGHSKCEREGLEAASYIFAAYLMTFGRMPAGVEAPEIPEHYESNDPRRD